MIINGKKYLTEKELALLCGRSVHWIRKMRYSCKKMPSHNLNGRILFLEDEVNKWLESMIKESI